MTNIQRLGAVHMHNGMHSAWKQPLAVVYWLYTTILQGALLLL